MDQLVLGIDLGTSSVKVVLVDNKEQIITQNSALHNATISSEDARWHEQNVGQIFEALEKCLSAVKFALPKVQAIQIAGQMHGCVLWSSRKYCADSFYMSSSNHISWMDQRCTTDFLATLPKGKCAMHTGYGCATLCWIQRNGGIDAKFDCAGTVMDLLVCSLCDLSECVMSEQNAASWGYAVGTDWEIEKLSAADFPVHLLPKLTCAGTMAGRLKKDWLDIPADTPVFCALGDLQATAFPHLSSTKAMLNLGTSAQLCFADKNGSKAFHELPPSIDSFPYFDNSRLLVAASLNGGNVVEALVKILMKWSQQLTGNSCPSIEQVFRNVETLLLNDPSSIRASETFQVVPTLFGERHDSTASASVVGLQSGSLPDLSEFLHKVVESLVANLNSMLPRKVLDAHGIATLVLAGQATKPWYRNAVRTVYGDDMKLECVTEDCATAAYGAARFAQHLILQ